MKTKTEWVNQIDSDHRYDVWRYDRDELEQLIASVQADALRHAAEIARCDGPGWTGVIKTTAERISTTIIAEAARIEKGQG